ncbi:MAG TPA: Fic family protein [Spirochaetes bacterium]|nr:Fic family protein [Spirochaetota bacterium]
MDPLNQLIEQQNDPYRTPREIRLRLAKTNQKLVDNITHQVIAHRKRQSRIIPLKDQSGRDFRYYPAPQIEEYLHKIDIEFNDEILDFIGRVVQSKLLMDDILDEAYFNAILDEAYFSSRIEGAVTTRQRAEEMIKNKLKPTNKSEYMFENNYYAMDYILNHASEKLSIEIILELHRIVTQNTLEAKDKRYAGKFRETEVWISDDVTGEIIYQPPLHGKIKGFMDSLIQWVNEEKPFIHPVLEASIIHFYLSYIHPFIDGNGRTARALSYFHLIKSDYNFVKHASISSIINKQKNQYYRAFKEVEENESDLTYFLIYSVKSTYKAFENLENKIVILSNTTFMSSIIREASLSLNKRQMKLVKGFSSMVYKELTIEKVHKITKTGYDTSRKDLNQLVEWGLLQKEKKGGKYYFSLSDSFFRLK